MNYILQYDDHITKGKGQNKNIVAGDKWKVNASVPLLKILKENDRVPFLHMSHKTIEEVETDKIIPQFHVVYVYSPFLKQNKTYREKV